MQDVKAASVYASVEFRIDKKSWKQLDQFSAKIDRLKKKFNNFNKMKMAASQQDITGIRGLAAAEAKLQKQREKATEKAIAKEQKALAKRSKARSKRAAYSSSTELTFMDRMERLGLEPTQISKYHEELKKLGDQYRRNKISADKYRFRIKQLNSELSREASSVKKLTSMYTKFRTVMIATTAAYSGVAAGSAIMSTGKQYQSMQTLFNTVFQGESSDEMAFLKSESDRLGVSLLDSAKSYAQLSFAAREAGATINEIRDIYSSFTEASVVMGVTQDETMGIFRALIQMYSKTTAQAEELRGQLGDRLVGAWQLSADAMGMTTEEFDKAVTNRLIKANELIPALAQGIRKHVAGGLAQAVDNLAQKEQRLMNMWQEFKNTMFEGGLGPGFGFFVDSIAQILDHLKPLADFLGLVLRPMFMIITSAVLLLTSAFRDLITVGEIVMEKLTGFEIQPLNMANPVEAMMTAGKIGGRLFEKMSETIEANINVSVDPNSGVVIADLVDNQVEKKIVSELESSAGE